MSTYLLPDFLPDIRTWLRSLDLAGLMGSRWFFAYPDDFNGPWPAGRVYRAGGGVQAGDTPLQDVRVAAEIRGRPKGAAAGTVGTFADVSLATAHLESALFEIQDQPIGAETVVAGVYGVNVVPSPDPDDGAPRNIVNAVWTIRAASAAQRPSGFGIGGFGQ